MNALLPIGPALQTFIVEDTDNDGPPETRGRKCLGDRPMTQAEHRKKHKGRKKELRMSQIAVLDFETDPFDNTNDASIFPFAACLHSDDFETVIIWDENPDSFVARVIAAIETLPSEYTIYAHNGGKFDFMFLLHKFRGDVSFKGRGVMVAKVGKHELRDSFHLIPERLAAYQKDEFDYKILTKAKRNVGKNKQKIIDYMRNDCVYLLDLVKSFVKEHGLKLSIGQAAMSAMQSEGYAVAKVTEGTDAYLRNFFFGGRVECLAGKGVFTGEYKLFDVNSMYPWAMARFLHPIGNEYHIRTTVNNEITEDTIFLIVDCKNYGAFVSRTDEGETSAHKTEGRFFTTIWEYNMALKLGLIEDVKIFRHIECFERSDFSRFVEPRYAKRQLTKQELKRLKSAGEDKSFAFTETKKDDIFLKLLLNNAYGKYAQNPRNFKEHYITDFNEFPPEDLDNPWNPKKHFGVVTRGMPSIENAAMNYSIHSRPVRRISFNNVGTAASITGAARACLMEAIYNAVDPIYCDTDSLICKDLQNTELHPDNLGAWDLEDEFKEVVVAGKKLYGCLRHDGETKMRSKGAVGITYAEMVDLIDNELKPFLSIAKGTTINKTGAQFYMRRNVRATAKPANPSLLSKLLTRIMA